MYHKHHTKGIIVSGRNNDGSDRRVNVFTEDFGLINARVSGVRNINSKLRSGCQDFSLGDFSLVSGKTGWRVVSIRPQKNLYEIFRGDEEKIKIVSNILNLIKKLVAEKASINRNELPDEENEKNKINEQEINQKKDSLFKIVLNFFEFLEKTNQTFSIGTLSESVNQKQNIALAEALTLMRILHHLGFMRDDPELLIPISSSEIAIDDLQKLAPKRSKIISLINESLRAT